MLNCGRTENEKMKAILEKKYSKQKIIKKCIIGSIAPVVFAHERKYNYLKKCTPMNRGHWFFVKV